jgi:hypothetical protein
MALMKGAGARVCWLAPNVAITMATYEVFFKMMSPWFEHL